MAGKHRGSPAFPPAAPASGTTPQEKMDNFDAEDRKLVADNAAQRQRSEKHGKREK